MNRRTKVDWNSKSERTRTKTNEKGVKQTSLYVLPIKGGFLIKQIPSPTTYVDAPRIHRVRNTPGLPM